MSSKKISDKQKWLIAAYIVGIIVLLGVVLFLSLQDVQLISRVTKYAQRGQVPDVNFEPSGWFFLLIGAVAGIFSLLFLLLKQWANYFLSRKLVLSYAFFTVLPLGTSMLVFFAITRVLLGISSLITFEDSLDRRHNELSNLHRAIINEMPAGGVLNPNQITSAAEAALYETGENIHLKDGTLELGIYFLTPKMAGHKRVMMPTYPEPQIPMTEHTAAYEAIYPSWFDGNDWTGMIHQGDDLYIRSITKWKNILILTSTPVDERYLQQLPGFQVVRMEIVSNSGTNFTSSSKLATWIDRLPILGIFNTRWDCGSFNWGSGFFESYGHITFGLEIAQLDILLENASLLDFFYSGQKSTSVKVIIGILLLVLFTVAMALIFGGYLVHHIARSLNLLAEGHERIRDKELHFRLPYIGRDQLGSMGTSFNQMVTALESLMTEVAEKEKYHEELRIARDIQMSLLPNVKSLSWCDNIAANCTPAHDVGGDYYEVLKTPGGRMGIFIADVSGKGTSAAFYMAEMKGVLIALQHLWDDPHELMVAVNEIMRNTLSSNVFISAAYLLLDPDTQTAALARAGHCPAFHVNAEGKVTEISPPGMAIGLAGRKVFERILKVSEFEVTGEDKVLLYTDGLDEMTHGVELYGLDRIREVLSKNARLSVDQLKEAILGDVLAFLADNVQNDDLTLVVASQFKGEEQEDADNLRRVS